MSFSNIDLNSYGDLLQIYFTDGIQTQISEDIRDFEMIQRLKVQSPVARSIRFQLLSSFGPASVQYRNPGTAGYAFPKSFAADNNEYEAKLKELMVTMQLEHNVWQRAQLSKEALYADPLVVEMEAKSTASKRQLGKDTYGDGTGVIGQLPASAAALTSPASNQLVFQLSTLDSARGHVGFFEFDDILILRDPDATVTALDTNLATEPTYWKVIDINRPQDQVTLQGLDSSFAPVATISSITTQAAIGAVFYRFDQPTIPDLTASIADYGTVTEVIPGLASLTAADGRVVHGMTMTGALKGSEIDAGANPIDVKYIQQCMDRVKNRVGQSRYKWKMMNMAHETHASLIESRETDRRFISIDDNKRGCKVFAYVHGNDTLECNSSEYVPKKRIYMLPEQKGGEKVLQYHGTDFLSVKAQGGSDWLMLPGSGTYINQMAHYLRSVGTLICKHPAAIGVVRNFVNT